MTRSRKKFPFLLWHRRLGLIALLLLVVIAITGILLNHTESLNLDEKHITSDAVLNWYGLNPVKQPVSFPASDNIITQWDDQLFFNSEIIFQQPQKLRGAVEFNNMIIVAFEKIILLLEKDGEIIEEIPISHGNISNIGSDNRFVYIQNERQEIYASNEQIISWEKTNQAVVNWATSIKADNKLKQHMKQVFRGQGLTLERVILDLHSGRLFNPTWGIYLMDASALIMLWLGISGTWIWWSRNRKTKSKRHYQKHHSITKAVKH